MIKKGDTVKIMQIHRDSAWYGSELVGQYVKVVTICPSPQRYLPNMWKSIDCIYMENGHRRTPYISRCVVKKVELEQVSICEACGAEDSIRSNGDAGCCMECGTAENYHTIEREV